MTGVPAGVYEQFVQNLFQKKGMTGKEMQEQIDSTAKELMTHIRNYLSTYTLASSPDETETHKEFVKRLEAHGIEIDKSSGRPMDDSVLIDVMVESKGAAMSDQPREIICYRCSKPGHIARGCKEYRCHRCNLIGHIAVGCRAKLKRRKSTKSSHSKVRPLSVNQKSSSKSSPSFKPIPAPRKSLMALSESQPSDHELSSHPEVSSAFSSMGQDESQLQCTHGDDVVDVSTQLVHEDNVYEKTGLSLCSTVSKDDVAKVQSEPERSCVVGELTDQDDVHIDKPVWSVMSEDLGFDVSNLSLQEFLDVVHVNKDIDIDKLQTVLQCIRDDITRCQVNGGTGMEAFH